MFQRKIPSMSAMLRDPLGLVPQNEIPLNVDNLGSMTPSLTVGLITGIRIGISF